MEAALFYIINSLLELLRSDLKIMTNGPSSNIHIVAKIIFDLYYHLIRVSTWTGKPGKGEGIFQSGKIQRILNRLEKSGKITQSTGKFREFQKNVICYF